MRVSLYQEKDTPIHRLDPRTKIISSIFLFLCALTFNHPLYLLWLFLLLLVFAYIAKSFYAIYKLRYVILVLFSFSLLLWPFFVEGERIVFHLFSRPIHLESILYAFTVGLRLVSFVIIGLIYVSTTKNEETSYGLLALGLPYPFSFAISTALRLVPTFVDSAFTILEAQISRGLDLQTKNPITRLKRLLVLAIPMFVTAIRATNMLGCALESRGFSPSSRRTFYLVLKMGKWDYLTILSISTLFLLCLYARFFLNLGILIKGRI
ncbi:MAG: energy-coupling factor transporter transmembrane protein EcfT [Desulfobacterota bacterium]|nr:energy-coupling factor transporter transmembrane protein EcfT [Thermodesulfobacteriota bacterium]MDW8001167.1 energy-coupling factor transporter transmembrane component T [Deltaproteobacteria bacterium]